jgi:hypothetical protein
MTFFGVFAAAFPRAASPAPSFDLACALAFYERACSRIFLYFRL